MKKRKRSAWFEGLLEAESLIKDGYTNGNLLDEPLWFTKVLDCGSKSRTTFAYASDGRKQGAIDYVEHYNSRLSKLKWDEKV